jgi:hypothetical protein
MIVLGLQPWPALFGMHSFHTCYLSRYLSNEFAGLKETFLLLFVDGRAQSSLMFFENTTAFSDLFLNREIGGFAGKMQMFENLAAEAKE